MTESTASTGYNSHKIMRKLPAETWEDLVTLEPHLLTIQRLIPDINPDSQLAHRLIHKLVGALIGWNRGHHAADHIYGDDTAFPGYPVLQDGVDIGRSHPPELTPEPATKAEAWLRSKEAYELAYRCTEDLLDKAGIR